MILVDANILLYAEDTIHLMPYKRRSAFFRCIELFMSASLSTVTLVNVGAQAVPLREGGRGRQTIFDLLIFSTSQILIFLGRQPVRRPVHSNPETVERVMADLSAVILMKAEASVSMGCNDLET